METRDLADKTFAFGTTPFYFLRHGETPESRDGVLQGQNETLLTAAGRKMAENAGHRLAEVPLGSIYASPLKRAWQTASIVSVLTGAPVHPLPGLMERHWGVYQGQPKHLRPSLPNPKSAEPIAEFSDRIVRAIESISGPAPVLIVTHSGVFRVICEHIGVTLDRSISVTSGLVLKFEPPTGGKSSWRIGVV